MGYSDEEWLHDWRSKVESLLEKIEENTRPKGAVDNRYDPFPPERQVCVNTMTPCNNWVNKLSEVAQSIVDQFHYPGRTDDQFKVDMGIGHYQSQLWEKIQKLAAVLKEDK